MSDKKTTGWRSRTRAVRAGLDRSPHGETSEALFLNSGFVYDNAEQAEARFLGDDEGFIYSRYGNPTVSMFEERLAQIDGSEACFATASGMAAVFAALLCQLQSGDHVVASRALFGSCHYILTQLLPRYGIEADLVDGADLAQWRDKIKDGTSVVFFETPSNPTLDLIDLEAVIGLAHGVGARVVVDNVFSTPILQRPAEYGADVVVYSGTKHMDGQGRILGGAVLSSQKFITDHLMNFMRHTGPAMSAFNAWILLKGLETMELRLTEQCRNALSIAKMLEGNGAIERVLYPSLESFPQYELAQRQMNAGGSVITFDLRGGKDEAFKFLNSLQIVDISNNLGDAKSLITHPATTTHRAVGPDERAKVGIGDGMVRLSVGLEDPDDLMEDLAAALDGVN
ncbi:MAG: O-succinylhomoserine sulfhydrylase [Alphaproteobacteria bacterium]|jgi:O-succinylhomoserine sulfhydrylase|nr:O-succinylhomoserine sulfhydrylase [Alphaproteobacteria bacterium]MDP6254838.1 O-succinylhomoserine sulfhydrylase [Alphaproteobacteria bacterium]MDP7053397.1 O-succinylhomoserine sulfhydrylase [Alphaproteobacteria bacterium]MDP7228935.1 O-succinylhomoserine sulfhydrylase [Alphaproteobacteria bacterium]MDP7461876.1 O-succinylhomoserine sulfhydrylase [Alphaproteobacteria bacterium]|tara:strand:- start:7008 stop:8201 length:1194 start_codon:yes stop_codon:yes gene_type:complete